MSLKTAKDDAARISVDISSQVSNYPNAKSGLETSIGKIVGQIKGPKISKQYPLGVGSEIAGRYNDKAFFPTSCLLSCTIRTRLISAHLVFINCGNSSYANAVLQCLVFTPPLTAYFIQGHHSKACSTL